MMQKFETEKPAVEYLKAHGCKFSGERIGSIGMLKSAIFGQQGKTGRLLVRNNNQLEMRNSTSQPTAA